MENEGYIYIYIYVCVCVCVFQCLAARNEYDIGFYKLRLGFNKFEL